MQILFKINNEIARRSVLPILDQMQKLNVNCSLMLNSFCKLHMGSFEGIYIDPEMARNRNWDFIISANPVNRGEGKGKRVFIHHGSMFGNNSWSLGCALHSDLYFGLSDYDSLYIKKHLKEKFDTTKFLAAGNPANDYLMEYRHLDAL